VRVMTGTNVPVLYTTPVSANGRKTIAVARHLSLDVEIASVDVYRGEGQTPAYRSLNPWGKVPTLVDGNTVLWESNAILVYFSEVLGDYALSSRDPKRRADMLRWMFWEASHWQPVLTRVLAPRVAQILFSKPEPAIPSNWNDPELATLLQVLGAKVDTGFVCGPEICLADFALAGMTTYFRAAGFPEDEHPSVARWMARINQVPAWSSSAVDPWRAC